MAFFKRWWPARVAKDDEFQKAKERILAHAPVPVFWLFGKTGSGKTSVVKFLTGAERAEIGSGFRPQTRQSQQYDFPSAEWPVVRFLDTRGIGETHYDPSEDIEKFRDSTHVMIVTVRAKDHALSELIEPLRTIRAAKPDRPVLLALTCLHELYPQQQHPSPDPFRLGLTPPDIPDDLRRCLEEHERRFAGLVDRIVPIDLTKDEEGFEEKQFGGDRLTEVLVELLPAAYRQTLLTLGETMQSLRELHERRAMPFVMGYSVAAATLAAVPIPWVDIPAVVALHSHLVYQLASIYEQPVHARLVLNMASLVGGRLLTRLVLREPLKLIPFVGIAANAAITFAYTYGLGKACCWYFGEIRKGHAPSQAELEKIWREQIQRAAELWKKHR